MPALDALAISYNNHSATPDLRPATTQLLSHFSSIRSLSLRGGSSAIVGRVGAHPVEALVSTAGGAASSQVKDARGKAIGGELRQRKGVLVFTIEMVWPAYLFALVATVTVPYILYHGQIREARTT
ncbi:hypothetical protein BOTBODRAFT_146192 [Botryobasidium botryosum FD-172 SS1]|uniref:Uncharacterized protein n=1 Tax=Botryobasidium botryosum (strain FD-172 SS1) TaxID=930990 RepID=A0A067MNX2_BOTB1|nr:hypothetical protein BOTBODRAFT_146192 [Botryobasidium botryosum FD-172 SS1]